MMRCLDSSACCDSRKVSGSSPSWWRLWCLLLVSAALHGESEGAVFYVKPNEANLIGIPASETSAIYLQQEYLSPDAVFVLIQLHTHSQNISLSSESSLSHTTTKTGTNVGLTSMLPSSYGSVNWFVRPTSAQNVLVVAYVQEYKSTDPVPGGCNQVFNIESDPSIVLRYSSYKTEVWFQWANVINPSTGSLADCESFVVEDFLTYDVYVTYLPQRSFGEDEFRNALNSMLTPSDIKKNAVKVFTTSDLPTSKSRVFVTSQTSQGALYAVIVSQEDTGGEASYVTAVTYACDLGQGDCSAQSTAVEIIFAVVLTACGIFLLLLGHRFFQTTQVIVGFVFSCLLFYLLMSLPHTLRESAKLSVSIAAGVVGGCMWFSFWYFCAFPIISVFLAGLCCGYLVSSALFFSPFANIDWWQTELNYGMAFACVILLFAVLLMAFTRLLNILSCSIMGAFMLLMGAAIPLRSSLQLVFLNSIYHQTEKDYLDVRVIFPFHAQDIALIALWPVLAVVGLCFQYFREWDRPHFEYPRRRRRTRVLQQALPAYSEDDTVEERNNISSVQESDDERTSLLRDAYRERPPPYHSVVRGDYGANLDERSRERNCLM